MLNYIKELQLQFTSDQHNRHTKHDLWIPYAAINTVHQGHRFYHTVRPTVLYNFDIS